MTAIARGKSASAIDLMFEAWTRLKSCGWQDMMYAPHDGTDIEVIEMGSTGIHTAAWISFKHEPLDMCGAFFVDGNWPSHPLLWRPVKPQAA